MITSEETKVIADKVDEVDALLKKQLAAPAVPISERDHLSEARILIQRALNEVFKAR